MIEYSPLTKAQVLVALYNASRPLGMEVYHYTPEPMDITEAEGLLASDTYFDYLHGRVLKVCLEEDGKFEEYLYDRDNGQGAAQEAVMQAVRKVVQQ